MVMNKINIKNYNLSNILNHMWLIYTRHVTEYAPAKTGDYMTQFSYPVCSEKYLKAKHSSWKNMLGHSSLCIICSSKLTVSSSFALRKLFAAWNRQCPQTNIRAGVHAKWRPLIYSLWIDNFV